MGGERERKEQEGCEVRGAAGKGAHVQGTVSVMNMEADERKMKEERKERRWRRKDEKEA